MRDPCTGRAWQALIEQCKQTHPWICHLCGEPIPYEARTPHRLSYEVDHVLPKSTHLHLALVPGNHRPSHRQCNRRRSDRPLTPDLIAELTARFGRPAQRPALAFFEAG